MTIDGIPVYCAHNEIISIDKLIANPRNPNTHPKKQLELLAKIIKNQGWRVPITVSKRSGFIVRGHGRMEAAKMLGVKKVPIDLQDYETEAMEWADLIADNRISELSSIDDDILKDLLEEINTGEIDMDLTGFTDKELEDLLGFVGDPNLAGDQGKDTEFIIVSFKMTTVDYEDKRDEIQQATDIIGITPYIQEV